MGIGAAVLAQLTLPLAGQPFHYTVLGNEDICPGDRPDRGRIGHIEYMGARPVAFVISGNSEQLASYRSCGTALGRSHLLRQVSCADGK